MNAGTGISEAHGKRGGCKPPAHAWEKRSRRREEADAWKCSASVTHVRLVTSAATGGVRHSRRLQAAGTGARRMRAVCVCGAPVSDPARVVLEKIFAGSETGAPNFSRVRGVVAARGRRECGAFAFAEFNHEEEVFAPILAA